MATALRLSGVAVLVVMIAASLCAAQIGERSQRQDDQRDGAPIGEQVGLTENEPESPRSSVGGCMGSPCRGCSGWLLMLDWAVRTSVPHPAGRNPDACAFPSRRRPAQTHALVCVRG